jgi:hypothetical protein
MDERKVKQLGTKPTSAVEIALSEENVYASNAARL